MARTIMGTQKKQLILILLYLGRVGVEDAIKIGFSKHELIQAIHKLKKEGYEILLDKEKNTYFLANKSKPLTLDVKITRMINDSMAEGKIIGSIPATIMLKKTKLNGSSYVRLKCRLMVENDKYILVEV